ncbi:MAG: META domain-containing protein [Roseovarius sp.]|jgi:heat shock protein HslJ|nr:META domain-containing protein [Roseovarius sp.]
MRLVLLLSVLSMFGACKDETVTGYGGDDAIWTLQSLDGRPFGARATLIFPEEGQIAGQAPCNSYSGQQTAPYPWFATTGIAATKRACPDLDAETRYLRALAEMTLVEVVGDILILSNDTGREMIFSAAK